MPPRIAFIVTEDWYFLSHRLPMARAARGAGFDVHVLSRIAKGQAAIEAEGFTAHSLSWSRGSVSPAGNAQAVAELARVLRRIRPDIVHNIALKPALLGSLAALMQPRAAVVNSITGVGSSFLSTSLAGRIGKAALGRSLALLMNRARARAVVQNPDDAALLAELSVKGSNIVLIPGSGVDTDAKAYLAFLDAQSQTNKKKKAGVQGYCMGGPLSFRTAAALCLRWETRDSLFDSTLL